MRNIRIDPRRDVPFGGARDIRPQAGDIRALCRSAIAAAKIDHPDRWISHRLHRAADGAGHWDEEGVLRLLSALLEHALACGSPHAPVSLDWRGSPEDVTVEVEFEPRSFGSDGRDDTADHAFPLAPLAATVVAYAHGGAAEVSRTPWGSIRWTVRLPRGADARAPRRLPSPAVEVR
jgi:hypothetical protein